MKLRVYAREGEQNVDARDSGRYKQVLLAKRRELTSGKAGTIAAAGGPGGCRGDVIDQAYDAAEATLQVRLRQTDSRLL